MFSFLLFTLYFVAPSPQASHEGDAGALEMGLLDGMVWCSWHLESKGNLRVINQHCPSIIPTNKALFSGGERAKALWGVGARTAGENCDCEDVVLFHWMWVLTWEIAITFAKDATSWSQSFRKNIFLYLCFAGYIQNNAYDIF